MNDETPIAVVTGANRGLGLETCKQLARLGYQVILTSRSVEKGKAAVDACNKDGLNISYHALDVTDADSVNRLKDTIETNFGRLDVLVNNAGIFCETMDENDFSSGSVFNAEIDNIRTSLETNTFGPLRVSQALIPLMKGQGRVVNVSSGMGQLSDMNGGSPGYRLSKTGLNVITRILADELKGTQIKVNSICPGWVRTDMGGANADRSVEQGAETIVWAATLPDDGSSGGFFRDKLLIPW